MLNKNWARFYKLPSELPTMSRFIKKLPYILCYIVAFAIGVKQLREPDIWWQLLTGRWMLEHGQVTHTDVFSYTMAGQPWINVKWLYEIIIALLEKALGPESVMLLQSIVNVGIVWALFKTIKQQLLASSSRLVITVIAILLFLFVTEYRMAGRPEMISHLFAALLILYLWTYRNLSWKAIVIPIILELVWANMHEAFPVGLVLMGAYTAGCFVAGFMSNEKQYYQTGLRAFIMTLGAATVIAINPNGIKLLLQPFEIYRQVLVNKYTTELFSIADPMYWTIQAKWHIALLLLTFVLWLVQLFSIINKGDRKSFTPQFLASFFWTISMGYLSLTANRNIPFAQIAIIPSLVILVSWGIDKLQLTKNKWYIFSSRYSIAISTLVAVTCYYFVVSNRFYKAVNSPNRFGIHISMLHNPVGAANFIEKQGVKGLAFTDYLSSSYLLWRLYPQFKSYIDLRDLDIFSASFFDEYFKIYHDSKRFSNLDKKYNFNYAAFSTSQMIGVQQELYWGEGYYMIYVDPVCSIFLKTNKENEHLNNNTAIQKEFSWPEPISDPSWAATINHLLNPFVSFAEEDEINAPIFAAQFYNSIGNYPLSIKTLLPAMGNIEDNAKAKLVLGSSYLQYAGVIKNAVEQRPKLDSATVLLLEAKDLDPSNATTYQLLGNLAAMKGDLNTACDELNTYTKLTPTDDFGYFSLGLYAYQLWLTTHDDNDLDRMVNAMQQSYAINHANAKACLYLAQGYFAQNNKPDAIKMLRIAMQPGNVWQQEEATLLETLKKQLGL